MNQIRFIFLNTSTDINPINFLLVITVTILIASLLVTKIVFVKINLNNGIIYKISQIV
jgi:hypothetical protein